MRPVNLIPPEHRHGEHAPLRSGPLAYIVVGALVLVLAGVTAVVLTGNQIDDRRAEAATLEAEDAAEAARAERLAAFVQFRSVRDARVSTVMSLANSRFDWERVMRELSLILPSDVWLVNLTASASPHSSTGAEEGGENGGSASGIRASAPGPALELSGCATGQEAVAGFVTALKDIDGVTRVGVETSQLSDKESGAGDAGGSGGEGGEDCRTREFIAKFEIVAAFDAAPVPPSTEGAEVAAAPEPEEASSESSEEGG
jgi:Tfp pilus assembly protein PilN